MKKTRKMLSYFTKVFLVFGLLFSNLSGLSYVFAYEDEDNFTVIVEDEKIIINYNSEIEDTDSVKIEISENYTYLDGTDETLIEKTDIKVASLLKTSTGLSYSSDMLTNVLFDGLYELSVSLYNETEEEDLGTVLYSENITHDTGLTYKVYKSGTTEEILPVDGIYNVSSDVDIVSRLNIGGFSPSDKFMYEETPYEIEDLLNLNIPTKREFTGLLYGEYTDKLEVSLSRVTEENTEELELLEEVSEEESNELVISSDINFNYLEYPENSKELNLSVNELMLTDRYQFDETINLKDGVLYVTPNDTEAYSVSELYDILSSYVTDTNIEFTISNSEYEDIIALYQEYVDNYDIESLEPMQSLEEYLASLEIVIDDTTVITLYNEGLTVTYKCIIVGDMNDDEIINQEDLQALIDQIVGTLEENLENGDMNSDEELTSIDAIMLNQAIMNGTWNSEIENIPSDLEAYLEVMDDDIVSGDEFEINYVLTVSEFLVNGIEGLFNYDPDMLELVDIKINNSWIGNNSNGKFLYMGEDALALTEVEGEDGGITYEPTEYVILTATFKALAHGESTVSLEDAGSFGLDTYYDMSEYDVSTQVIVNASDDNTLASLTVSGQNITLEEGVLEYELTVENDNTSSVVEAITRNIAAKITSIVAPEELAVGENVIVITVMAENEDELIYTVKVTRKEAPQEETVQQVTYVEETPEEEPTVTAPIEEELEDEEDEETPEEDNNTLSRVIIIILILLVIAGLVYLIFKDDEEDNEIKKTNKDINKLKNKDFSEVKETKTTQNIQKKKPNNNNNHKKKKK